MECLVKNLQNLKTTEILRNLFKHINQIKEFNDNNYMIEINKRN